jgi:hypothetical protein
VFGQPADLEPILNTASEYKLNVIEPVKRWGILGNHRQARWAIMGYSPLPHKQVTTVKAVIITDDADSALYAILQTRVVFKILGYNTHLGYNYCLMR